jgi:hypothetical protein
MIRVWQPKSMFSVKPSLVTKKMITGALALWVLCLAPMATVAKPEQSFIEMLNAVQQALAGNGIGADGGDGPGDGSGDSGPGGSGPTAKEYWISDVDPIVQSQCKSCHQRGGTAANSGARLVFTDSAEENHLAMQTFVTSAGGSADLVLSKMTGGAGHGGGTVISSGSTQYKAFEQYFLLLDGGTAVGVDEAGDFWDGVVLESPETTLRRASLLLAGKVAQPDAITRAETSENALRGELIKLMRGKTFHDFLISGADDRLLTDGLVNGADFSIRTEDRFPALVELMQQYPKATPDDLYGPKPFLTRAEIDWEFRWAVHREPLELIAHIIETNQSYKKILTADYTMVNPISSIAYRSEVDFAVAYVDDDGRYTRHALNTFKPGKNRGHIAWDEKFSFNYDARVFDSFGSYQTWPHAGVLSTHAWLARYPSTDTNRNRARARWTYYHFLGVDIEKSAPRTTDPVALADTNNPTMNNTACTVCHERMDPLAGAYQLFGDKGHFKDQYGGMDSLARSYLNPEQFGGEEGSSLYQQGDTWYRDMRTPGFEGDIAPYERDSLQWLARQIADDPRFATATVKFWWPAIFGAEPLALPEDPDGPDYDQRLRAFNAQEALVAQLAARFVAAGYRAKELFADMLLSPWYRVSGVTDAGVAEARAVELATVGSGRLLTPEELDRKNRAVFGRTWGQEDSAHYHEQETYLGDSYGSYKNFYGGADSAVVTKRNRQMTPMMSNVSENMAVDLACQAVGYDFTLPAEDRVIFDLVDRNTLPGDLAFTAKQLPGRVAKNRDAFLEQKPIELSVTLVGGRARVFLSDSTSQGWESTDADETNADVILQSVVFRKDGEIALRIEGVDLPNTDGFVAERWQNDQGDSGWRGDVREAADGWWMHEQAWVAFEVELPAADYEVEVQLATSLFKNNVNDAMNIEMSVSALENVEQTQSAKNVRNQMSSLYQKATNKILPADIVDVMVKQLVEHAEAQTTRSWRDGAHCDVWRLWPDMNELSAELERQRFNDPRGVIRGWTMIAHSILSSAAYLHD